MIHCMDLRYIIYDVFDLWYLGCYFDFGFDLGICVPLDLGENHLWI